MLLFIGLIAIFLLKLALQKKKEKYQKNWFLLAIFIVVFFMVLLIGVILIDALAGTEEINKWPLVSKEGLYIGTVTCTDSDSNRVILVGKEGSCKFDTSYKLINPYSRVLVKYDNRSEQYIGSTQGLKLEFYAPKNVNYVFFEILDNGTTPLSVGNKYSFLSKEDYENNKDKFLNSFLTLLAVVLFTVPRLILDLKEMIVKERNKN